jgi:hypothetical protein
VINLKLKKDEVLSTINILESLQLVHAPVRICTDLLPTIQTNNTNNTIQTSNTISTEPQKAVAVVEVDKSEIVLSSSKRFLIKKELLESWSETYPKEFLELSLKEMKNWILVNDAKAPKSQWGKFMNGWFQRGWERHRKTMASNPTSKISESDLNDWLKG